MSYWRALRRSHRSVLLHNIIHLSAGRNSACTPLFFKRRFSDVTTTATCNESRFIRYRKLRNAARRAVNRRKTNDATRKMSRLLFKSGKIRRNGEWLKAPYRHGHCLFSSFGDSGCSPYDAPAVRCDLSTWYDRFGWEKSLASVCRYGVYKRCDGKGFKVASTVSHRQLTSYCCSFSSFGRAVGRRPLFFTVAMQMNDGWDLIRPL